MNRRELAKNDGIVIVNKGYPLSLTAAQIATDNAHYVYVDISRDLSNPVHRTCNCGMCALRRGKP